MVKAGVSNGNGMHGLSVNENLNDSKGNKITIGDRVSVLWGFDNRIHVGEIIDIKDRTVRVDTINRRINTIDQRKITKIM